MLQDEDPKPRIEAECASHHCAVLQKELDKCTERVQAHPEKGENCTQELFEFLHCVDHCVRTPASQRGLQ